MLKQWMKKFSAANRELYREEIRNRNYSCFRAFSLVGLVISFFITLFGLVQEHIVAFHTEHTIIFAYFAVLSLLAVTCLKKHKTYITFLFYAAITPIMGMAILMGTFLDKQNPSITFMVFLCVFPIFILDKPWRIFCYITAIAVIYGVCCYMAKDYELFIADFVDLVAFYLLSVGTNFFTLNDRFESVRNFMKFRSKSETDLLTGLYNRGAGEEEILGQIENHRYGAFFMIDIDNFKYVNDMYGHTAGDEILQAVAGSLRDHFKNAIAIRMGGDEFAIYAIGLTDLLQCRDSLDRLFRSLRNLRVASAPEYSIRVSLGGAVYNETRECDFKELYEMADRYLYEPKTSGKSCYRIGDTVTRIS